jgi:hypothetical protein
MFRESVGELSPGPEEGGGCPIQKLMRSSPLAERRERAAPSWTVRVKRIIKRRLSVRTEKRMKRVIGSFLDRLAGRCARAAEPLAETGSRPRLMAGEAVRVRPREEIEATLDHWRSLKGCAFLEEMAVYCGTTQRILKRVERFIDERDYRIKRASGIILLEGLICSGTSTTGRCDRACYYFWREEWLQRTSDPDGGRD